MQRIGRYEVIRSLGKGGMGQVFLARDPKLERSLALKLLRHDDHPEARSLFEREAKALAALSHPNIVTIYEIAESEDRQFIAMEYLPGRSLRELLLHDKPSRDAIVTICAQVATALAAAHDAGILHRDIKPENVVVGNNDNVKVVDFGIARRLDAPSFDPSTARRKIGPSDPHAEAARIVDVFTRTIRVDAVDTAPATGNPVAAIATQQAEQIGSATKTVFGTPAYMAPEVLMGSPSSTASDVYSLGVMLYEGLAGRRPYEAPNLHEVIARVIDGGDPPATLDDPLSDLVARMLARDPASRPSLGEVGRVLGRRRSTIAALAPARRWWIVPIIAVVVLGVVAVGWKLRSSSAVPGAPAAVDRGPTALTDLQLDLPSYGVAPDGETFGRVLALILRASGLLTIEPDTLRGRDTLATATDWLDAARRHGSKRLVRGSISERSGTLYSEVEVIDVDTGKRIAYTNALEGHPDRVAVLVHDIASWLAGVISPGTALDPTKDAMLADELLRLGAAELREHHSGRARTLLAQAVLAKSSTETWDRYAASLAMAAAKRELMVEAARKAYELAPPGPRKRILRASELLYQFRFAESLAEVESLEHAGLQGDDLRDVLFLIGEGHWHEGRHDRGFAYFKRVLELDSRFAEAASHAGEYAIVRRLEATAREYTRMQRSDTENVDFAMGNYQKLLQGDRQPYRMWSQIVLGLPIDPAPTLTPQQQTYERLTAAVTANDLRAVDKEVGILLEQAEPFSSYTGVLLANMAEVTIAAELKGPSERILARLREKQPAYHYRRLSILATPMLGAPKFPRDELTERLAHLTLAIDAEMAGDRAKAITMLDELVKNPTYEWDFVERAALLRNLRALGRTREAAALCADTTKPPVIRYVFHVLRRICRS